METRPLQIPLTEETVRSLKLGQTVLLSGTLYTARDAAHKYLAGGDAPPPLPKGVNLQGGVLYHCGPVMVQEKDGSWRVTAAGPTTSAREEPYQAEVLRRFGVRALVGKGGMGEKTRKALAQYGAVYLSAVGGAAQVLAAWRSWWGTRTARLRPPRPLRRLPGGVRLPRGHVDLGGEGLPRHRHHGRVGQQPP